MFGKFRKWFVATKMDGKKIAPIYSDAGFDLDFDWQNFLLKFWIKKYGKKNNIYKKISKF